MDASAATLCESYFQSKNKRKGIFFLKKKNGGGVREEKCCLFQGMHIGPNTFKTMQPH